MIIFNKIKSFFKRQSQTAMRKRGNLRLVIQNYRKKKICKKEFDQNLSDLEIEEVFLFMCEKKGWKSEDCIYWIES